MSQYTEGQKVIVDGVKGFTVIKVNKSSCKVNSKDGVTSIKPNCFIEEDNSENGKSEISGKSRKRVSGDGKIKPATGGKPIHPEDVHVEDCFKGTSRDKSGTKKVKREYVRNEVDEIAVEDDTVISVVKKEKKAPDAVAKTLSDCDTPNKVIAAVKAHKAYAQINADAFKKLIAQKNELNAGLFRMRAGNLLRGAIKRK